MAPSFLSVGGSPVGKAVITKALLRRLGDCLHPLRQAWPCISFFGNRNIPTALLPAHQTPFGLNEHLLTFISPNLFFRNFYSLWAKHVGLSPGPKWTLCFLLSLFDQKHHSAAVRNWCTWVQSVCSLNPSNKCGPGSTQVHTHAHTHTHPRPIKVNDTSEYLKPTTQQTLSPSWNFRGCRQHPVMEHVCSLNCDKSRP